MIARGKSVATRSMVMFETCNLRFQIVWYHELSYDLSKVATIDRTIGRTMLRLIDSCDRSLHPTSDCIIGLRVPRLIVRSVTGYHVCSYDRSQYAMIARTIGRRIMQRSIDRTIGRRPSGSIVHQSLIATTSRTISSNRS